MLSKEKLRNLLNVLNLDNNYYIKDTDILNVLTAINNGDDIEFLKALFNISPENHKELDTHLIDNVFTLDKFVNLFFNGCVKIYDEIYCYDELELKKILNFDTTTFICWCIYYALIKFIYKVCTYFIRPTR